MKTTSKSLRGSKRLAIIRNYEPCRIEHDLLAKVFEALSYTTVVRKEASQEGNLPQKNNESAQAQNSVVSTTLCSQVNRLERAA